MKIQVHTSKTIFILKCKEIQPNGLHSEVTTMYIPLFEQNIERMAYFAIFICFISCKNGTEICNIWRKEQNRKLFIKRNFAFRKQNRLTSHLSKSDTEQ